MAGKTISNDNFAKEVEQAAEPVLVDFWAEWCGPCKVVEPIVDELAKELKGKLTVGKVDVDEQQQLAQRFNVMSIPTLILFKDGEPVETVIGVMPKPELEAKIKPHL